MSIGILTLQLQIPGCKSLKEKRSRLKPLISRLHREFNVSVAELDHQDDWDSAILGVALIGNQNQYIHSALQAIIPWLNRNWPDVTLVDETIEMIN